MTITINVPVFPLRKEIADRKRRRGFPLCLSPRDSDGGKAQAANSRYTAEGLEFDVSGMARPPRGSKGS